MALDDIREQLRDQANELLAKIQETSVYNNLRERYESQTPPVQRAITMGGIALFILFMLMFPWSYIDSSDENMAQFEENRELIQGLLRAASSSKEPPPLPPPVTSEGLRSIVTNTLQQAGLTQDQIGNMQEIPNTALKEFAVPGVTASGLAVQIKKLNLAQILEIGTMFENLRPGLKFIGLDVVQSPGSTHYYDINAHVVAFGIPTVGGGDDESPAPRGGGAKRPGTRPENEESEE